MLDGIDVSHFEVGGILACGPRGYFIQECAQNSVPKRAFATTSQPFLLPALSAEGGGFERESPERFHCRALPRNCLSHVYLKACGEVAERLKAAVC